MYVTLGIITALKKETQIFCSNLRLLRDEDSSLGLCLCLRALNQDAVEQGDESAESGAGSLEHTR